MLDNLARPSFDEIPSIPTYAFSTPAYLSGQTGVSKLLKILKPQLNTEIYQNYASILVSLKSSGEPVTNQSCILTIKYRTTGASTNVGVLSATLENQMLNVGFYIDEDTDYLYICGAVKTVNATLTGELIGGMLFFEPCVEQYTYSLSTSASLIPCVNTFGGIILPGNVANSTRYYKALTITFTTSNALYRATWRLANVQNIDGVRGDSIVDIKIRQNTLGTNPIVLIEVVTSGLVKNSSVIGLVREVSGIATIVELYVLVNVANTTIRIDQMFEHNASPNTKVFRDPFITGLASLPSTGVVLTVNETSILDTKYEVLSNKSNVDGDWQNTSDYPTKNAVGLLNSSLRRIGISADYTANSQDCIIAVTQMSAPITITLPAPSSFETSKLEKHFFAILDHGSSINFAITIVSANNIDSSPVTINGRDKYVLNSGNAAVWIISNNSNYFTIVQPTSRGRRIANDAQPTLDAWNDLIVYRTLTAERSVFAQAAINYIPYKPYTIKDETGQAGTFNIRFRPNGTELVDGQSEIRININYGAMQVYTDGNNWFTIP
jgi:hypothetical protein